MKKVLIRFILPLCLLSFVFSCDDMNSLHQDDLDRGEIIYPGKVDSIEAIPGNNRVKLSWLINADSRIIKTVITWNNGKDFVSVPLNRAVVEPVRVGTELSLPEGAYIFVFYTMDEDGNSSLETEKTVEIYGSNYGAALQSRNIVVMKPEPGGKLQIKLPEVLDEDLLYSTLIYTDNSQSPPKRKSVRIENRVTDTVIAGVSLETFQIASVFRPKGALDTVSSQPRQYVPYVVESDILLANGIDISKSSAEKAGAVTKLVYPMHVSSYSAYNIPDVVSFQDLYYFPNLKELDLTGTGYEIPVLVYSGNNYSSEVGGGDRLPFMRRTGDISNADKQIIKNLLASGQLTKLRYVPNSLGLDADLAPYVGGAVELVSDAPDEILIPDKFNYNCAVENAALLSTIVYSPTVSGIAGAPAGADVQNVYKITMVAPNGSIGFALPAEYEFNLADYKYLKFKVYAPAKEHFAETYDNYRRLWLRFFNGLFNETRHGNGAWDNGKETIKLTDEQLQKWEDITVDLGPAGARRRVIKLTIGAEGGGVFPTDPDMVFYFANFRFSKQP
jgi:hypothetical protein